jgi:glycosyltransferase involved in cell wall biosynthesis
MRVLVCGAKVPFARGGAEMLVESLCAELDRRGFEVDTVTVPYNWANRADLLRCGLAWRMVDLTEVWGRRVDLVIATRFPSYVVKHPNKSVWLVHQVRQAYDWKGTRWSDFDDSPRDAKTLDLLRGMDRRALGEARRRFAISRNVAERLRRFNGLDAEPLYPPPQLDARVVRGPHGDAIFSAGRLDPTKRFDLLLHALAHCQTPVRARLAGEGPERERLEALAAELGVSGRVDFLGWIDEDALLREYRDALGVFYAPFDEDYGYVTVEAFRAAKPVVTTTDSGGVLEFVEDGRNGYAVPPADSRAMAARLDELHRDRALAARLGRSGQARIRDMGWSRLIAALTGAPAPGSPAS